MNVHARAVGVKVYTVVLLPSPILRDTVPVVSPTVPVKDGVVSEVTLSVLDVPVSEADTKSAEEGVLGATRSIDMGYEPEVAVVPPNDTADISHVVGDISEAGMVLVILRTAVHAYPPVVALQLGVIATPAMVTVDGETRLSSEIIVMVIVSPSFA